MRKKLLTILVAVGAVIGVSVLPALGALATLSPIMDTYVYFGQPNQSYSALDVLNVGGDTSPNYYQYRSYLRFDLSSIPNDAVINSASLVLEAGFVRSSRDYYAWHVSGDSYVNSSMTWNTQPPSGFTLLDTQSISSTGTKTWNLLANGNWNYGADLVDTDNSLSLLIQRASEAPSNHIDAFVQFNSSETVGNNPRLLIEYQSASPIPSAVWLLGSSLLGLAGWRKFRNS
jgi:hypothetical protein